MAATDNYCISELGRGMQLFEFQEFFLHHQLMLFRLEYYLSSLLKTITVLGNRRDVRSVLVDPIVMF